MTQDTAESVAMDAAALKREAQLILSDYPHVRIEQSASGWLIGMGWAGIEHVGHSAIDPNTSADPRDLARRLSAIERGVRQEGASYAMAAGNSGGGAAALHRDGSSSGTPPIRETEAFRLVTSDASDKSPPLVLGSARWGGGLFTSRRAPARCPAAEIMTQANGAVMIVNLPNDRAEAQALVRSAISEAKLIRLDAAEQPGWMAELVQLEGWQSDSARRDGRHPLPEMTEAQRARLSELWSVRARIEAINRHAADLERSARDADLPMLQAMAADIWSAGP